MVFARIWRLHSRRRSTVHPPRATAPELSKSIELEHRVSRLELKLTAARSVIDTLTKRAVALQAQLDHLAARIGRS